MTYLTIPLFLILQFAPATLPAHQEVCIELKSAGFEFPHELIIDILDAPAIFLAQGTELVISSNSNNHQSWFVGAAEKT